MIKAGCVFLTTVLSVGCVAPGIEKTATERFTFEAGERPAIEVRLDAGSIEVLGRAAEEISVRIVKKARAASDEAANALLEQMRVEAYERDGTIHVAGREGTAWGWEHEGITIRTGDLRSDVELHVPRSAELELVTEDGTIAIEGVEGRVDAESGDGAVRLRSLRGSLRVRTEDGSVVGSELSGDVEVTSGDGRIELDGSFAGVRAQTSDGSIRVRCNDDTPSPTKDWTLRTLDGSITLRLPDGMSADVEAATRDGRIHNELSLARREQTKTLLKGRLGEGGNLILLRTSDGNIHLQKK